MARECCKGERKLGRKLGGGGLDPEVLKGIQGEAQLFALLTSTQVVRTHQGLKPARRGYGTGTYTHIEVPGVESASAIYWVCDLGTALNFSTLHAEQ